MEGDQDRGWTYAGRLGNKRFRAIEFGYPLHPPLTLITQYRTAPFLVEHPLQYLPLVLFLPTLI